MRPIYAVPFGSDFIDVLTGFILKDGKPVSDTTVVFPGKRPALYLRRRLAEKLGEPFYAPAFLSIEAFMDSLAGKLYPAFSEVEYHDAIWLLYQAVLSLETARTTHSLGRKGFDRFYYWGQYLFSFIDQIDSENVPPERLKSLEKNAELGYDVPESINELLVNISALTERFHTMLDGERLFTRGYKCSKVLGSLDTLPLHEFGHVYFAGLFGLTGVERAIIKRFQEQGLSDVIVEGDVEDWPILKGLATYLGSEVEKVPSEKHVREAITFSSGFDTHAQVRKVSSLLGKGRTGKTAIVLPLSEALFPLLTFAVDNIDTPYNISLAYPLQRTPVFDLISNVVSAQASMRERGVYPARAYLKTALHPFVKNLTLDERLRTLLLTLERALAGDVPGSPVAHRSFITLDDMERAARLLADQREGGDESLEGAVRALTVLHNVFFRAFEKAGTLNELAGRMEELLDFVLRNTPVRSYVLSGEIFTRTFELLGRIKETRFSKEIFDRREKENRQTLCGFLLQFLKNASLPFETRPVEPLEIIGVLESRSLRFDTVIMLDVNEGVIPQPRKVDPLVPLGVYEKLGIPSPEYNEEMYRYYFYRLIESARRVHLVYADGEDKPRSRYVEQLVWDMEKAQKALDVVPVDKTSYRITLAARGTLPCIEKGDEVWKALLARSYSPSDLDDYIRCPVFFCYGRLFRFEERKEISEDIDVLDRGQIIHDILHNTFAPFSNSQIDPSMGEALVASMREALENAFRHRVITGEFYLFKKLAAFKLETFIKKNVGEAPGPFVVRHLEHPFESTFAVKGIPVRIRGRVDRIDYCPADDEWTIIDYKTGGTREYPRGIVSRVDFGSPEDIHRQVPSFQLPLYVHLLSQGLEGPSHRINAKLIFLKNNQEELLFKTAKAEEREDAEAGYMRGVETVLGHILDRSRPFAPFDDMACPGCPFNLLCHVS